MRLPGFIRPKQTPPTPPPPPLQTTGHTGAATPASTTPSRAASVSQGSESGSSRGPQTFEDMGLERVGPKKWNKPSTWNNIEGSLRAPSQPSTPPASPRIELPPPHRIAWDHDLTGANTLVPPELPLPPAAPPQVTTRQAMPNHHLPPQPVAPPPTRGTPLHSIPEANQDRTSRPGPDHPRNQTPQDHLSLAREDLRMRTGANPPAPPSQPPHHPGGNQDFGLEYYGI